MDLHNPEHREPAGYRQFLATKTFTDTPTGFEPSKSLNPKLFPFQSAVTAWALRRGRASIFADCGLGKTPMQLEWANQVVMHTGRPVLILAPLAVAKQTQREGIKFDIPVTVCRKQADVGSKGIHVTNYEMLQHFDPAAFGGVVLDESSILKSYSGVFRNLIISSFRDIPFRLACTATPAPNDYTELGSHCEFMGVMKSSQMLATFFNHDGSVGQGIGRWNLKRHGLDHFWEWMASWSVMVRRPSDLGFSDDGFVLPALQVLQHTVPADGPTPGYLFPVEARSLSDRLGARRQTIGVRAQQCAELTTEGTWVVWCNLNAESEALTKLIDGAVEIRGSDSPESKEDKLGAFSAGQIRVLVTKPTIAGYGLNWQHCHQVCFVGLSDSFEQYYQAIRRCWRFGQTKSVDVHVITAETEGEVVRNIQRKERDAARMAESMVGHMKDFNRRDIKGLKRDATPYERETKKGEGWTIHLGDCIDVVQNEIEDNSVDFSIFSPPFPALFTYSNSDRDMGNSKSNEAFLEHFAFLVEGLLRVTKPGRLCAVHCANNPISKYRDGFIGLSDFRGGIIREFLSKGWIFHSEVCIWKDPVVQMQRTKALGLLYKQLRKDATLSRQGIPDNLVIFRKHGENSKPVTNTEQTFPLPLWQRFASPVWMDIRQGLTLQYLTAKEEPDERHICPLQLEVIERAVRLWTNEDEVVFSPYAGIGSEGYQALCMDRRFLGVELKRSYFELACRNLHRAVTCGKAQPSLFAKGQ